MEVHHHGHHSGKKTWRSYVWEFLMLFLAVFCGFLAEYFLEHKIEEDRAKELANSFYAELKADSASQQSAYNFSFRKDTAIQYLKKYFKDSSLAQVSNEFAFKYYIGLHVNRPAIFEPRAAILNQLISSGMLRYFKSHELQQLCTDLSVSIKEIAARCERANQYIVDHIDPFIIQHNDESWISYINTLKGGILRYRKEHLYRPCIFNNPDKLDKIADINMINLFSSIVSNNADLYYKKYAEINSKLMRVLEKEYHCK